MKENDLPRVHALVNKYLRKLDLHQIFSEEEAKHYFLPVEGVLQSFVIEVCDFHCPRIYGRRIFLCRQI
jgi:glycylpeptide N-tetradecanoyltransferase